MPEKAFAYPPDMTLAGRFNRHIIGIPIELLWIFWIYSYSPLTFKSMRLYLGIMFVLGAGNPFIARYFVNRKRYLRGGRIMSKG